MSGFGQYDTGGGSAKRMPTAIYDLVIVDADVKRDGSGNVVRDPKSDKARFKITLEVANGEFKGERITRTANVTYAPSQDGNYGPFAQFIEAATGIRCGDVAQKKIGREDLRGRMIRALVKHANGYNNVTEFVTDGAPAARPAPAPEVHPDPEVRRHDRERTAEPATQPTTFTVDFYLSEVPLAVGQSIRALGKWAGLNDAQLATKIGFFAGRTPLAAVDVDAVKDKIKAERAA